MPRPISYLLMGIGLLTCVVAVPAQRPREEIAMELFKRWDVNRDGRLTVAEVPPRARPELARLAREAGLDPADGVPLDRLRKQLKQQGRLAKTDPKPMKQKMRPAKTDQQPSLETQEQPKTEPSQPESPTPRAAPASASSFDGPSAKRSTKGFGSKASAAEVPAARDDSGGEATPSDSDEPANKRPKRAGKKDPARGAAQAMLRRFDRNRNDVLDKEEWGKIRGDPAKSDANKDGVLTVDELTVHLSNYAQGTRSSPAASPSKPTEVSTRKRDAGSGQASRKATSRRSYRFLTATERVANSLPGDMRDWFLQNDRDGDGQIAMYEFASAWSAERTRAFARLDLNNDGLVTPREYVKAKTTP